jgi:hypothetical protein
MPHACAINVKKYSILLRYIFSCSRNMCQEHEEPQEQKLKKRFKSNFQTRNKTRLCNSKIKTQKLQIIT